MIFPSKMSADEHNHDAGYKLCPVCHTRYLLGCPVCDEVHARLHHRRRARRLKPKVADES